MESSIVASENRENTGLKMQKKDNIVFVDFWDAFSNRLETKILDSCHKFKLLNRPLNKNKDARNTVVYHLANFLLSNFVIKKQQEDVAFVICHKTDTDLDVTEYFDEHQLFLLCVKILKKFEKYLCFTVIEYEGTFEQFSKLLSSDQIFYKKIVSKIINTILKQNSKKFNMKDIQKVLSQYNLSNNILKKNYAMKLE